jgi:hypothetical protein
MIYKPQALRQRSRELINARNWAIGLVSGSVGVALLISELRRIQSLAAHPMNYAYLVLFSLTAVLILLWIWATQRELDLLFDWLDPERYEPPTTLKETIIILSIASVLVALLFSSRDPFLYSIVFSAYSAFLIPWTRQFNTEVRSAILKSKERIERDIASDEHRDTAALYKQAVDILHSYYFGRRTVGRLILILGFASVSLVLAISWKLSHLVCLGMASYVTLFLTIAISEIVIGRWRITRDRQLRPIAADLVELQRGFETSERQNETVKR